MLFRRCLGVLGLAIALCQAALAAPVSLDSLLDEMTNLAGLASFPDPAYTCVQASSYDRPAAAGQFHPRSVQYMRARKKQIQYQ